jgi:cyanophycin synthetase
MWSYANVLETIIDIADFEKQSSLFYPEFISRLIQLFPGLQTHKCDGDYEGRFIERLNQGTWMAHILEHIVIEMQVLAGVTAKFGKTRETSKKGVYYVIFRSPHELIAREALSMAIKVVLGLFNNEAFDFKSMIERLKDCVIKYSIGPSTAVLIQGARSERIPTFQVVSPYNWYQFNYGKYSKTIWTTLTENTSFIALSIAENKQLTKNLLERFGIPVAQGKICQSIEEAVELIDEFSSLTVKPLNSNRSHGVTVNINQIKEIEKAFSFAKEYSDDILVECYYPGDAYCINTVGDKIVGILRAYITKITGNGKFTVAELIDELNQDPLRGKSDSYSFPFIEKDDEAIQIALSQLNLNLESTLKLNQTIILKKNDFIESLELSEFHPSILEQAILSSKILQLDIAGVDLIIQDIKSPLSQENGVVLEVNAGPGISKLHKPSFGVTQNDLSNIILENIHAFDNKDAFIIGNVVSSEFNEHLFFSLRQLFARNQLSTGFLTPRGVHFPEYELSDAQISFSQKNKLIFRNKDLDSGVLFVDEFDLMNEGLIASPHFVIFLSLSFSNIRRHPFIQKESLINKLYSIPLDALKPNGVAIINGDEPLILNLLDYCEAPVIFLSHSDNLNHLYPYLKNGSKILAYRQKQLILIDELNQTILLETLSIEPQQILSFMTCFALSLHFNWDIKNCLSLFPITRFIKEFN